MSSAEHSYDAISPLILCYSRMDHFEALCVDWWLLSCMQSFIEWCCALFGLNFQQRFLLFEILLPYPQPSFGFHLSYWTFVLFYTLLMPYFLPAGVQALRHWALKVLTARSDTYTMSPLCNNAAAGIPRSSSFARTTTFIFPYSGPGNSSVHHARVVTDTEVFPCTVLAAEKFFYSGAQPCWATGFFLTCRDAR